MRLYSILALLFIFLFSGCSWIKFPSIHKVSVQQGNIISQEMVDKLQVGMTKPQVQFILGTPLIVDTCNPTRWDYYYTKVDWEVSLYGLLFDLTFDPSNTLLNIESELLKSDEKK